MRLFVAVRLPPEVLDAVEALARSTAPGVRWTTREQWHITLRFFGEVDDPVSITRALTDVSRRVAPGEVVLGPSGAVLNRRVIHLPVAGLDDLAASIEMASAGFGDPPPRRRFHGHLTLARTKGARVDVSALELQRTWIVHEVELLRSHLDHDGTRYETLERFALGRC